MPAKVDLSNHVRGDVWQGIVSIGPVLINGLQPAYTLSSVRIDFRRTADSKLGYRLQSGAPVTGRGIITISNAATWLVTVPQQSLPLAAGRWVWAAKFIDSRGEMYGLTLYEGSLMVDKFAAAALS